MKPQAERLNPEPMQHCKRFKCTFPVCHCYDAETISKEDADRLLLVEIEPMLQKYRVWLDDLKYLLSRAVYISREQRRVYQKRKQRLQKNFIFWKIKYDLVKGHVKK